MKAMKKIVSLLLVLTMAMGLSLTAFAEEPAISPIAVDQQSIVTVGGDYLAGKSVEIVRMLVANASTQDNVGYTLETAWQEFFNTALSKEPGTNATSQEVYDYVSSLKSEKTQPTGTNLIEFAKNAKDYYNQHKDKFASLSSTSTAVKSPIDQHPNWGVATFNNLTSGYYLVLPAGGSTATGRYTDAMLVNTTKDKPAKVQLKTEYPTVDKVIVADSGNKAGTSAQIGETVKFQLTAKVPNMTEFTKYYLSFKDTLSEGLTLNQESIKVSVIDKVEELVKNTEYTLNVPGEGGTSFEVVFADLKTLATDKGFVAGDTIKVEYTATLNEKAHIGTNSNTNKAELDYSTSPNGEQHGTSEPDVTHTYTFEIKVHKYANDTMETLLPGAVFELQSEEGTAIKLVKENETTYHVAKAEEGGDTSFMTVVSGDIVIKGLKAGKYKLVETAEPEGYNPLPKPVAFEIQAEYDENGALSAGFPKYVVDGSEDTQSNVINVQNKSGAFLPETGSIGTIGLTILGVLLVVGGLGFTSGKKKQQA